MDIAQWLPDDLKARMRVASPLQIIDVREPGEFASGHIPGAKLIPLGQLMDRYPEIDPLVDSVFVCRSGARSMKACEFMKHMGYDKVYNLSGGMLDWDGGVE